MATFTATRKAEDIWTEWSFDDFYVDDNETVLTDNGNGTLTAEVVLYLEDEDDFEGYNKILITVTFAEDEVFIGEEGPFAGVVANLTGGTVDSVEYFDNAKLLMTVTDLPAYAAQYFSYLLNTDDVEDFSTVLFTQDNLYVGTNNGLEENWEDGPADRILTGAGNDTVKANGGDDVIYDFVGKDIYNGGKGDDELSYANTFWDPVFVLHGIDANLATGLIVGHDGKTDRVKNIERVSGTFLDDTFVGDDQDNVFYGYAGADDFDGGDGFDRIDYKRAEDQGGFDGIKVDTAAGTVRDAFGYTDTFTDIERISGTDERDLFVDDASDMYYDGRDGDDIFRIRGGDDTLRGRDGEDEFRFIGNVFGDNEIRDWEKGVDVIAITRLTNMNQLNIYQDGNDAVVEFTRYATHSSIRFEDTDMNDLTDDVFGF